MTREHRFEKVSIVEQSARLTKPFTMIDLAQIDDLVLSVYLCQGTMPHHRHLDQDELFLVHSGTISLETEWGTAVLRPGELAVAQKGVAHRSSSLLRSTVLLLQPRLMVNRRNGNRRLFVQKGEGRVEKVSALAVGRQIVVAYRPITLTHVDTFAVTLMHCQDSSPWFYGDRQCSLVFCFAGHLDLETEEGNQGLSEGELVVLPKETAYRIVSPAGALVLGVQRHTQPGLPLPE